MQTAKLFINGRSQAVRLPKDFRFEGDEVFIKRVGDAVVLLPRKEGWGTLEMALAAFEPGFAIERNQPELQKRERLAP
jgi:antitoxin VapB